MKVWEIYFSSFSFTAQTILKAHKTSPANTTKNSHHALNSPLAEVILVCGSKPLLSLGHVRWAQQYTGTCFWKQNMGSAVSESWFILDQHCPVWRFDLELGFGSLIRPSDWTQLRRPTAAANQEERNVRRSSFPIWTADAPLTHIAGDKWLWSACHQGRGNYVWIG